MAVFAIPQSRLPASEQPAGNTISSPSQLPEKENATNPSATVTRNTEIPDAEELLKQALTAAKMQRKNVLVYISGQGCKPCRMLEAFLRENQSLFEEGYRICQIDIDSAKNGETVVARLGGLGQGIPWMIVLDPEGKELATSSGPKGNFGFPVEPSDINHFMTMIRKTSRFPPQRYAEIVQVLEKQASARRKNADDRPAEPEKTEVALPEPQGLLGFYEKSLTPYRRMKASWTCNKYTLESGKSAATLPDETWTIHRDGERARLLIRSSEDHRTQSRSSEHIIHQGKKWLVLFSNGIVLSEFNPQNEGFSRLLSDVPGAPSFGFIQMTLIPDFLRTAKLSAEKDLLERYEVCVLRGETEAMTMTLWLDPTLGYAPRRIHCDQKSPRVSLQFEAGHFQEQHGVFIPREGTLKSRTGPQPVMQSYIEFVEVDGKRVSRTKYRPVKDEQGETILLPERQAFCEWKLEEIDISPEFADGDLELSQKIPNGTRVSMQDDILTSYVWQDGKIVLLNPDAETSKKIGPGQ